ncbi:hypothetical protein LJC36_03810, partial [Desulfovibrio sp. OttesenSCG-928-C14]|nr:hypothetical protein [Desulfovibrio sp. OttesenSCG-928-C14]
LVGEPARSILLELKHLMEDDDASALARLQGGLDDLSLAVPGSEMKRLARAIELFDYGQAIGIIDHLLK